MPLSPHIIVTGGDNKAINLIRRSFVAKYGAPSWAANQIYQVPWGTREWPSADDADQHAARANRDANLIERFANRNETVAPLPPYFGVSLDAEFYGFLGFEDPRCLDADLIRAFRVRIAEIKAASGGRAKVYSWNVGAPDNKDGVEPEYISRVSSFLLGCGFDGWISALVPQTVDENRLAIRTRRVAEAHDAVLAEVRRTNAVFQGFISFQPIFRHIWQPLISSAKGAILGEIGDRPWLMWCQAETEESAAVFAQGVAA